METQKLLEMIILRDLANSFGFILTKEELWPRAILILTSWASFPNLFQKFQICSNLSNIDVGDGCSSRNGEIYKMLVTVLAICVTNFLYLSTLASSTDIQKTSPTLSHQHHSHPY